MTFSFLPTFYNLFSTGEPAVRYRSRELSAGGLSFEGKSNNLSSSASVRAVSRNVHSCRSSVELFLALFEKCWPLAVVRPGHKAFMIERSNKSK